MDTVQKCPLIQWEITPLFPCPARPCPLSIRRHLYNFFFFFLFRFHPISNCGWRPSGPLDEARFRTDDDDDNKLTIIPVGKEGSSLLLLWNLKRRTNDGSTVHQCTLCCYYSVVGVARLFDDDATIDGCDSSTAGTAPIRLTGLFLLFILLTWRWLLFYDRSYGVGYSSPSAVSVKAVHVHSFFYFFLLRRWSTYNTIQSWVCS